MKSTDLLHQYGRTGAELERAINRLFSTGLIRFRLGEPLTDAFVKLLECNEEYRMHCPEPTADSTL